MYSRAQHSNTGMSSCLIALVFQRLAHVGGAFIFSALCSWLALEKPVQMTYLSGVIGAVKYIIFYKKAAQSIKKPELRHIHFSHKGASLFSAEK